MEKNGTLKRLIFFVSLQHTETPHGAGKPLIMQQQHQAQLTPVCPPHAQPQQQQALVLYQVSYKVALLYLPAMKQRNKKVKTHTWYDLRIYRRLDSPFLLRLLLLAHHTCLEATLFICTASPTPHESFSRAGSYNPTRFEGSIRGPASGFLNGTRAARASASLSAAAAALEECRVERRTPLLLLPGRGRRVAPPTLAVYRVRNISVWYVRLSSLVRLA